MYIQCVPFPTDLQILLTLVMHPIKDKHMSGIIVCASPRLFCGHALKHAAAGNVSLRYLKSIDCRRFMCSRVDLFQGSSRPMFSRRSRKRGGARFQTTHKKAVLYFHRTSRATLYSSRASH